MMLKRGCSNFLPAAAVIDYFSSNAAVATTVDDFWNANSGNIAAMQSADSPGSASATVTKLNTFDYQGKILCKVVLGLIHAR